MIVALFFFCTSLLAGCWNMAMFVKTDQPSYLWWCLIHFCMFIPIQLVVLVINIIEKSFWI